jgi:hypothetical protein
MYSVKSLLFILIWILSISSFSVHAAVWQWSVPVTEWKSEETKDHPNAFLWIPEDCKQVRSVVVGMHNMCEETIFERPAFRQTMAELGFAVIWISPVIDQQWKVDNGCQKAFDKMLADLAEVSGYSELKIAPIVPIGHSAMATFPWNFAAWNKDRTLAVISYKGDAPRTNLTGYGRENLEWGRTRNLDGIPGLMIEGEYEWWEARVNPALAFRMMYPGSCISFLCDAGHGHFDVSDQVVNYICLFLKKAAQYRLPGNQPPDTPVKMIELINTNGWLVQRWSQDETKRSAPAPFATYKGDKHDAFWYFDKEMATNTERYYAHERGKKNRSICYLQNGELLKYSKSSHEGYKGNFSPNADGLTLNIKAEFTDSTHTRIEKGFSGKSEKISIDRICGPVEKVNDTTFTVRFYRMGLNSQKRTGDIWLMAHHDGDKNYKSSVQQLNIRIPYRNTEGNLQHIKFSAMDEVSIATKSVSLQASSDSGLPVFYYVKEGPSEIKGNQLVFTTIPPRSKFPVKVTVVAWQYGIAGKVQTAEPVERCFYIEK